MSPTRGRRANDPGGVMPPDDERRFHASHGSRAWVIAAFVAGLCAIGFSIWSDHRSSDRDATRDRSVALADARRNYELCRQRRSVAQSQNANADTAREAHLGARHRSLELARLEPDPARRRILLEGAKARLEQYRAVLYAEEPACERLYPRGAAAFKRLGPILPSDAATTPSTPTPSTTTTETP